MTVLNQEDLVALFNTPYTATELQRIDARLARERMRLSEPNTHRFEPIKDIRGHVVGGNSREITLTIAERDRREVAYTEKLRRNIANLEESCSKIGSPTIKARAQTLITKLNDQIAAFGPPRPLDPEAPTSNY